MGFSSSGSAGGVAAAALEDNSPASYPFSFSTTTSFSDLLNSSVDVTIADNAAPPRSGRLGAGVPKFKSAPPPSLPLSPPFPYFAIPAGLSPTELLDSPVLLSSFNILPSPTTGALKADASDSKAANFNTITSQIALIKREEDKSSSDFTFQAQPLISYQFPTEQAQKMGEGRKDQQQELHKPWILQDQKKQSVQHNNDHQSNLQAQTQHQQAPHQPSNSQYVVRQQDISEDDEYNWRKYGQKQVKGSENPRSYYKCTHPGCPTKKKVERSFDGQITEIVYKGTHCHSKPVKNRRSSSSSLGAPAPGVIQASSLYNYANTSNGIDMDVHQENSFGSGQMEPCTAGGTPDNSSISIVDDELDRSSPRSRSHGDDFVDEDDDQPEAKRWKGDRESECISAATGNRTLREPRVVVQTPSDIDILDDGYRWRKYGQKVVKGNPNPRSYYKCTYPSCPVRKHVERAAHDIGAVITTYEGKHNHDVPVARGSSHSRTAPPPPLNYHDNNVSPLMAMGPSALNYGYNCTSSSSLSQYNTNASSSSEGHSPFLQEMLQVPPGGFGLSGYRRSNFSMDSSSYNANQSQNRHTAAKEEPTDDVFFESLLC